MMKPAAGTAAPEAITPLMKALREVGLRAKPVNTPSAGIASVVDPPLSDISVLPSPCRAVGVSRDTYARTCQLSRRHAAIFAILSHGRPRKHKSDKHQRYGPPTRLVPLLPLFPSIPVGALVESRHPYGAPCGASGIWPAARGLTGPRRIVRINSPRPVVLEAVDQGLGREWRPSHSVTRPNDCRISALVMCSNAASRHSRASDWPFDCAISHQAKAIT